MQISSDPHAENMAQDPGSFTLRLLEGANEQAGACTGQTHVGPTAAFTCMPLHAAKDFPILAMNRCSSTYSCIRWYLGVQELQVRVQ